MWKTPKICAICGKEVKTIIYSDYKNHILSWYDEECFFEINNIVTPIPFGEVTDYDGSLD